MQHSAFFDPVVFNSIIDLTFDQKNPHIAYKLRRFISHTDCYVYPGYWSKNRHLEKFIHILTSKGRVLKALQNNDIQDQVNKTPHFIIGVTSTDGPKKMIKPVYSLNELLQLIENNDNTCFFVKEESVLADFKVSGLPHAPSSIIINDRYFFDRGCPVKKIILILENVLNNNIEGNIVLTLFYSRPFKNEVFIEEINNIENSVKEHFSSLNLSFEAIENRYSNSTHDRFIVTDFLCYRSTTSFDFLTENKTSTLYRYLIFECPEFNTNIQFLTQFLSNSKQSALKSSKNQIIKSFLKGTTV